MTAGMGDTSGAVTDVVIRQARAGDLPVLADLRWEFRTEGVEPAEERAAFVSRFAERVGAALADGSWLVWVAEHSHSNGDKDGGTVVVGHVYASRIGKLPNPVEEPETHLYLSNLYVRPAHRGRGIAAALLDAALVAADGTDAALLWARPGTAGLYEQYGFGASPEIMERRPAAG